MTRVLTIIILGFILSACGRETSSRQKTSPQSTSSPEKIRVILDTDANNELDDQHAIAYMLFNQDLFDVEGITVNETRSGGKIDNHVAEAERVVELCGFKGKVPVIKGASGSYSQIVNTIGEEDFDGHEAVDFIIQKAKEANDRPLYLVPVGKLTNIALALEKEPSIVENIHVIWLGSNWPDPGEYNLDNDTTSVNPLLDNPAMGFTICTVRYGKPSGTAAVTASIEEIRTKMAGLGPKVPPVEGRDGGSFSCFGDYSIDLFAHIGEPVRALFDVCALAVLKNETWAEPITVPAPRLVGTGWEGRPGNSRTVVFLENFDREAIMKDFYETMERSMP